MSEQIAGIHNYCDRWCERCNFTAHCAVYADEQGMSDEEKDIGNKAFWDRLSHNFSKAFTLLNERAKEMGIDLDAIAPTPEEEAEERQKERAIHREHPLLKMSLHYGDISRAWRKQPAVSEKADEIAQQFELGLLSIDNAKQEANTIKDCLEVISWYETFIPPKMMRAVRGKTNDDGWAKENGFQNDYDGSAKIALISIDRSMQAWIKLYEILPNEQDQILTMLALLEKMKKLATAEFPEAENFIRPGFDE